MPICITCSTPVPSLYTTYSKADDRSLGKGVRLTQCPKCKRFADKYVEHDFVVLFIDLVLIKPQVYRHLLFNRLSSSSRSPNQFDPSIVRLGTLLILFDVYLTWARIESSTATSALNETPILTQYIFFLTLNILATAAQHFTIRLLVKHFLNGATSDSHPSPGGSTGSNGNSSPDKDTLAGSPSPPPPPSPVSSMSAPGRATAALSTALLVSSCTKLFPILLVIWPTSTRSSDDDSSHSEPQNSNVTFASRASGYVGWAVLVNNIEALLILLDCGYVAATGLAVAGALARYLVETTILGMVGLREEAPGGFGSVVGKIGAVLGIG